MTMIICAMTRDHVFMVSDRTLSSISGTPVEHHENKMVVLYGQMMLGYTGWADLDGMPTDLWVTNVLKGKQPPECVSSLTAQATEAFRRINVIPSQKRHAFLLGGYTFRENTGSLTPQTILITNFHRPDWTEWPTARHEFYWFGRNLGNEQVVICSVGRRLSDSRTADLRKRIHRSLRANNRAPQRILEILANEVRRVAESGDAGVGRNMLVASFPRVAYGRSPVTVLDPTSIDWDSELTTAYLGEGEGLVAYGPAVVSASGVLFGGSFVSNDPDNYPAQGRLGSGNPFKRGPLPKEAP